MLPLPLGQRLRSRPASLRLYAGPVSDVVDLPARPVHCYAMEERGWIARHGFWPLALLWLPVGVVVQAAVRFLPERDTPPDPGMWATAALMAGASPLVATPCGVPLALGCRRLWRLGYLSRRLVGRGRSQRAYRGGVGIRGAARARGDRCLGGDIHSSRLGGLPAAGA